MATEYVKQNGCLTQHKRFVPFGTHQNFCFAKLLLCWELYITNKDIAHVSNNALGKVISPLDIMDFKEMKEVMQNIQMRQIS